MITYDLSLSTKAKEEYEEIFSQYQSKSPGLGIRFSEELVDFLERIERNPKQFQAIDENYRRAHLKIFPYTIFYRVKEANHQVQIAAIWPQAGRPGGWK